MRVWHRSRLIARVTGVHALLLRVLYGKECSVYRSRSISTDGIDQRFFRFKPMIFSFVRLDRLSFLSRVVQRDVPMPSSDVFAIRKPYVSRRANASPASERRSRLHRRDRETAMNSLLGISSACATTAGGVPRGRVQARRLPASKASSFQSGATLKLSLIHI